MMLKEGTGRICNTTAQLSNRLLLNKPQHCRCVSAHDTREHVEQTLSMESCLAKSEEGMPEDVIAMH